MGRHLDFEVHDRFEALVIRTVAAVERTNAILGAARDRMIVSARWPGAYRTRRDAVASIASAAKSPLGGRAYLFDQAPGTPRPEPLRPGSSAPTALAPAPPARSHLQQQLARMMARAAAIAARTSEEAVRDQLAIVDAAGRDTRHWLLDEPRHTPETLLDIEASIRAIAKLLDEIEARVR